jgi:hypothetical protein
LQHGYWRPDTCAGEEEDGHLFVDDKDILANGRFFKIARLKAEYYEWVEDPHSFLKEMKKADTGADLFTFIQKITDRTPRFDFHLEWDSVAAVPITTYEVWWKSQINDKTRNMIRRAQKSGVEVRLVDFSDDLVKGIKAVYDESPLRQGKPFKHYGKSLEVLKETHITFLDRSQFLGAYYQDEMIGFAKLVHNEGSSDLMQIVSMIGHRDKAPTNALLAKSVEICAERGISYLQYGPWDGRSLIDFKKHHAFEQFDLPRYYVPLNLKGRLGLCLKLHRKASGILPQNWIDVLVGFRSRWNAIKYKESRH